ncbi:DUF481 domain-containing protein [Pseudogemmobacter faecipullorum]|uniref:DUF481 domain-containing protein n=1 Tax=Pseudogemmobacter faecipullorum TaxID=2755041 RepID=A0ABS8CMW1_9RHOB|nr:DUF481 domain-containing protein [Pseudogemmobacter faecipullorum]MCB5410550.1 DUF481 domain-containing protein [Pseudogemmobacter faecipullorum]
MKKVALLASASALSCAMAAPLFAQDLYGTTALDDRIEDIERDVNRDFERAEDSARFGSPEGRQGLSGSASLGFSGKTGNNESQDLSVGLRIRHAEGPFQQTIGAVLDYSESDNSSTKEDVFVVYDANYYFNDNFYGFILGRAQSDGLADELTASETANGVTVAEKVKRDGFLGFGPGYRVVNTPDMAWRVQAGVGISYLEYGDGRSVTEEAAIASSRFYYKFSDNVFLTNDTDVLNSSEALRANNDFGVNFKITDAMSTRVSYLSEYNESRAIRTDNKLGVSIVFGF